MSGSYFVGVENAKTSEKLPYIQPGRYVLRVDQIKVFDSRTKGPMFVAEYTIVESEGLGANPKGSRAAHLIKLKGNDSALGNVKGMVGALTGEGSSNVTQTMCDAVVAETNPTKGTLVRAFAFITETKAGTDFTKVQYEAMGDNTSSTAPANVKSSYISPPDATAKTKRA